MLERIRYLLSITHGVHTIRLNSADAVALLCDNANASALTVAFSEAMGNLRNQDYPAVALYGKVLRIDGEMPRGAIELC